MIYYDSDIVVNQIVYASVGNFIIKKLKDWEKIPFINKTTYRTNRALAIAFAAISTLGISYTFSYTENHHFLIDISGLDISSLRDHAVSFLFSYITQQGIHHGFTKEIYPNSQLSSTTTTFK